MSPLRSPAWNEANHECDGQKTYFHHPASVSMNATREEAPP
jgi:hypothetical protein